MSTLSLAQTFAPMRLLGLVQDGEAALLFAGTVLLADLANFTGLTEAMAARAGTDGAELVGRDLNRALGPVIDAVLHHGGEVIKFSGDGLLCVFSGSDVAANARLAAGEIATVKVQGPSGEQHRFRIAIVHGPVWLAKIGGHRGRHELVAAGAAVERAQRIVASAEPGTAGLVVTLSPPRVVPPSFDGQTSDPTGFLPQYVVDRLAQNRAEWLQELRTLTIAFVTVDANPSDDAVTMTSRAIQVQVDAHGGQLLRFSFEGGALVAEIAFGLAIGAVATGPREALQCAAALLLKLPDARIGISTGRVLLGPIGAATRRQLTTLGSAVNLAARLMQLAAAGDGLIDEATWAAGQGSFHGTREAAALKGLGERVFWRLDLSLKLPVKVDEGFFGRGSEMRTLAAVLNAADPKPQPIVIQGEAGIGKSRLCRWFIDEMTRRGIEHWLAVATPVGRDTPYAGLAGVLATMCALGTGLDANQRLREVAAIVLGTPDKAPLLGDALGLSLPETSETRALTGHVRAENIREALTAMFRSRGPDVVAALIVDDAHWLDSASWALLLHLVFALPNLRIVIVTRPMLGSEASELHTIRQHGAVEVNLEPLSPQDITALMARRLGAADSPSGVADWVAERSRGNPFFAQELTTMLVADGHVIVQDGRLLRAPGAADFETLRTVASIESTLEQRIDRLGVEDAIVLKVASVIGPTFSLDILSDIAGRPRDSHVERVIQRLVAADMAIAAGPGEFSFRHRYTQDVAYDMLPREQSRDLHGRVAGWFESHSADRAEERAGELAHHWFAAGNGPKAMHWLDRAGVRALRNGADREAAAHFQRALSIGEDQSASRRAAWRRQLARAMFGMGEIQGVAREARAAVELVAQPLPSSPAGWAWLCGRVALGRLVGTRPRTRTQDIADLLEGARAAGLLAESAYFLNAPEMMVGSALLAVGLAELTPSAAPVSVAYGMLGVVAGMARLHATATRYLAQARTLSEAVDNAYQLGVAWFYTGMYHGCIGEWADSFDAAQRALKLTEALGADMQSGFELTLLATNALYTSEYASSRAWMDTVRLRAERMGNVQQQGWACNVVSVADLHQGRYGDAVERSERARQIFLSERDLVSLIIAEGVQCAALARSGRLPEALESADRATGLIAGARPTTWGQLEGFAGPCEVYGLAAAQGLITAQAAQQRAAIALAGLRLFAWIFPFGRARYLWIRGSMAASIGRRRNARGRLRRSIRIARHYAMPFEELRAIELLAPLADGDECEELLGRATRLKAQIFAPATSGQPEVQAV